MKQITMIKDLVSQGLEDNKIKNKLAEQFGKESYSMTAIYKYRNEVKFGFQTNDQKEKPGRKPDEQLITRVSETLQDEPLSSVRMIANELKEYPGTIHRYLTQYIGLVYKYSLWFQYSLSEKSKNCKGDSINPTFLYN